MKNHHGFINMMPHAKMFHPYAGLDGAFGEPIWRTRKSPSYGADFCSLFRNKIWTFEHKIKLFFPEIRTGVFLVAGMKYSTAFNEDDKANVSWKVRKGDNYQEYIEIKDFMAEITIDIGVTFGRHGISYPGSINCDFVDIYLFDQKLSIVTHTNNLLFAPYYMPYQTDFPFELARMGMDFANLTSNTERKYGFIIPIETNALFVDIGIPTSEISTDILNAEIYKEALIDRFSGEDAQGSNTASLVARKYEKYQVILPMSIFPENGYMNAALPIFNSEKCMSCCEYWMTGGGNELAKRLFGLNSPDEAHSGPEECPKIGPCSEEFQYETRNKLINAFIRISDMTWNFLDNKAGITSAEVKRTAKEKTYTVDKYDKDSK